MKPGPAGKPPFKINKKAEQNGKVDGGGCVPTWKRTVLEVPTALDLVLFLQTFHHSMSLRRRLRILESPERIGAIRENFLELSAS